MAAGLSGRGAVLHAVGTANAYDEPPCQRWETERGSVVALERFSSVATDIFTSSKTVACCRVRKLSLLER